MATFQKFEELEIWQLSRKLSQIVYNFTMKAGFSKEYVLKDQIKRSIGSVMDNIAEGFDRNGNAEFIHFLTIAKGSVAEVQSQLYRSFDYQLITEVELNSSYALGNEIKNKIGAFIKYLNTTKIKGLKFKDRKK